MRPATIAYRTERLYEGRLVAVDIPTLGAPQCASELVFDYTTVEQIVEAVKLRQL